MNVLDTIVKDYMKSDVPEFKVGDTVKVHIKIKEGNRERIQIFEGVVLGVCGNAEECRAGAAGLSASWELDLWGKTRKGVESAEAQALEAEIRTRKDDIQRVFTSAGVSTLYIGGGTPSVLPLPIIGRIVDALRGVGHPCEFEEFTVEVNPEDIIDKGEDYVRGLADLGVNRISMGVQSFDDDILKWMNRRHSAAQAVEAYHILETSGIGNISIDLIFGLPQMSEDLWRDTISKALNISSGGIPPRHISAYQLSVEEDSMLDSALTYKTDDANSVTPSHALSSNADNSLSTAALI